MSLINKMLRDLESRQNAQVDTAGNKPVFEDLKPVKGSGARAPSRRLNPIVLAIVVVGAGAYAWTQWGGHLFSGAVAPVTPPTVAMRTPQPRPVASLAHVPPPVATAPAATAPAATPPAPATVLVADKGHEQPVMNGPAQASPSTVGKTAQPQIVSAPVIPPKAPASAAKIVSPRKAGYWTVARGDTLYRISTSTGVGINDLSRWNHLGRHHLIHPGQHLRLTPPAASEAAQSVQRNQETPSAKTVAAAAATSSTEEIRTDTGVMDKKVRPLNAEERAEDEYRQALNLMQKGNESDARQHLRAALEDNAAHTAARELLAGLLLREGHWREAEQILEQGIAKAPAYYPFAQLLARTYLDHGSDQKALTVMQDSRQAGAGNADYMAFLAALYQRTDNQPEAIKAYSEAIKLDPQEGRSWLGLAISLEANQDPKEAGAAYQRAIETGNLSGDMLSYARQRLAALKK